MYQIHSTALNLDLWEQYEFVFINSLMFSGPDESCSVGHWQEAGHKTPQATKQFNTGKLTPQTGKNPTVLSEVGQHY